MLKGTSFPKTKLKDISALRIKTAEHLTSKQLEDARLAYQSKNFSQAIDLGTEAVKTLDAKNGSNARKGQAYALVARSYKKIGDLAQAEAYFKRAIAVDKTHGYAAELNEVHSDLAPPPQAAETEAPEVKQPSIGEGPSIPTGRAGHSSGHSAEAPPPQQSGNAPPPPPSRPKQQGGGYVAPKRQDGLRLGRDATWH